MQLQLERPIVFFDLETTGVNVGKDHIIQICLHKVNPDGVSRTVTHYIRPVDAEGRTVHIPEVTTQIHGITDADVADKPTFRQLAVEIAEFIGDADLAGYNSNKFDVPLLVEEFLRVDYPFDLRCRRLVDVQNIFHKMEQRTLKAAYRFYCHKELVDAHSADADTLATYEVLMAQTERYPDLPKDVTGLAQYSAPAQKFADLAGKLSYNAKGEVVFAFGKYKDVPVTEVLVKDSGYYGWIMNGDFPQYTKNVIANIKLQQRLANR